MLNLDYDFVMTGQLKFARIKPYFLKLVNNPRIVYEPLILFLKIADITNEMWLELKLN